MLSKTFFNNISPIIKKGRKRPLVINDFPHLPELWDPASHLKGFDQLNGREGGKNFIFNVLRVLAPQARRLGVLIIFMLALKMSSPVLIHKLIEAVGLASRGEIGLFTGIAIALVLCLVQLISAILNQHYVYHSVTSTQSAVNGINQRIYKAILRGRGAENKKGQVINRASADAELAGASLWALGEVVQIAFTMILTSFLLFYYLGSAAIAPLIILAALMPVSRWFSHKFSLIQTQIMLKRDDRVSKMSQFLEGIRVIKSFVWEKNVLKEVGSIREKEIGTWRRLTNYKALSTGTYIFASLSVSIFAFGIYIWQGNALNAATAFTCLTLFSYLEPCFRQLPKILGDISSSFVAGDRIASILDDNKESDFEHTDSQAPAIKLEDVNVDYEEYVGALRNINLQIHKGESVALIGPVGAGKTTLLKTIMGEIYPTRGTVRATQDSVKAYVPQDPYLFHASLEENITLGKQLDQDHMQEALFSSCLEHDLSLMPGGLQTEIAESGANLSGGQKQRVNLARAAYHAPGLVLMDDPLSALDPNTEKQIVDRLLLGLWKDCTRVVTTHRLSHLKNFDVVILLQDGEIVAQGSYSDLLLHNHDFQRFYFEHKKEEREEEAKQKKTPMPTKMHAPVQEVKVVEEEEKKTGEVAMSLYWNYFKAMAKFSKKKMPLTLSLLLITSVSAMLLPILQNRWLSRWTEDSGNLYYLIVYALIGLGVLLLASFQHFYWSRKAIDAAQSLHDGALNGLLSTGLRFFDANPSGRILNRFSRDLDAVEKDLSWSLEDAFMAFLNSIGAVFVMLIALPFMGLVVLPVLGLYWGLQKAYRSCMREAKRLMAVARSPRISTIKEVLDGVSVIRCYGADQYFQERFTRALGDYQRAFYGVVLINRWFSIRIPLISTLLSLGAAVGVIMLGRSGGISQGLAGMALVYAFRFWDSLNWTVRAFGEAEAQMTSVERLESMQTLPSEPVVEGNEKIGKGEIQFNDVFARYAPHLPNVLKGTSFTVPAGSKVGVIGRTGAGKSTLFSLLHRFIETHQGEILIDDKNINFYGLEELRQSISTIPQNPVLFAGTVRSNLDPFGEKSDEELKLILLKAHIHFLSQGLDTRVSEGGGNFSRGQRQLLCLARALVRNAKVIIVDEATASVDARTDGLIRDILMRDCPQLTVMIIAHKIQSVSECDMIIEMRDGKVLSVETPATAFAALQTEPIALA